MSTIRLWLMVGVFALASGVVAQEQKQRTLFDEAVRKNDAETVRAILTIRPKLARQVDHPNSLFPQTPLHVAASWNNVAVAKVLLEHKADPNAQNPNGDTPFGYAVWHGHAPLADLCLSHGAKTDIGSAAGMGRSNDVQRYLAKNPKLLDAPLSNGYAPLHWAAASGNRDTVELLLKKGTDIHLKGTRNWEYTALHVAAQRGHVEIAQLLLESGAKAQARAGLGRQALQLAVRHRHKDMVHLLLANGADPNKIEDEQSLVNGTFAPLSRTMPLHEALDYQDVEIASMLIAYKADVNAPSYRGRPLDIAIERRNVALIEMLQARGAKASRKTP